MNSRPPHTSQATADRGHQRREEILDAAADLFATSGYRGTSLAAIAERVGVTQPTVLHHFGTKENLLQAVVERLEEVDKPSILSLFSASGGAVMDTLPLVAQRIEADRRRAHLLTVLVAENLMPEDPAHAWFVSHYVELRLSIADGLRADQETGEVRQSCNVDVVATRIMAVVDGLRKQWIRDPDSVNLLRALSEFAETLRVELRP